jgi:hypothetical protein
MLTNEWKKVYANINEMAKDMNSQDANEGILILSK